MEIPEQGEQELVTIGNAVKIHDLKWDIGDSYSLRPRATPEDGPSASMEIAVTSPTPFMEPINWGWPIGIPNGESWRRIAPPDFCLLRYLNASNTEFSLDNGREAVLAGRKAAEHYEYFAQSLYAFQDHMATPSDVSVKNGPILHSNDFFDDRSSQNTVHIVVAPVYRGPTPIPPIRQGLPYNEDEVPAIHPEFWKDVVDGRIFLAERDSLEENELFTTPSPHSTADSEPRRS